jgi:type IV secretory pathway VirB4 component
MLVILDNILNRISRNRKKGKRIYIFIDEIYLLFKYEYTSRFIYELWKRIRKYGGCATGITQNIEELLSNEKARLMLGNSELIILLNQSPTDRKELAELLKLSETEENYITNVGIGEGLIKVKNSIIPFKNKFPKDTKLYKLMTTKLSEII